MAAGVQTLLESDPDLELMTFSGASASEVSAAVARAMPSVVIVDWDFPCFELVDLLTSGGWDSPMRILRVHVNATYASVCDVQAVRLNEASDLLRLVQATGQLEAPLSVMSEDAPVPAP